MGKDVVFKDEWTALTAGGCMNFPTWRNNPQFFFKSPQQSAKVNIKLGQLDVGEAPSHIGIYVAKCESNDEHLLSLKRKDIIAKAPFEDVVAVTCDVDVEADQWYVVVPATFAAGVTGKFRLRLRPSEECVLEAHRLGAPAVLKARAIKGEWTKDSAGGCRNHSTFSTNPQFLLKVKEAQRITIILHQGEHKKFDAIGFYVVSTDDPVHNVVRVRSSNCVGKTEFSSSREAMVTFDAEEDSMFAIIPCTFDPGFESTFMIHAFYRENATLSPLRDAQTMELSGAWEKGTAGGCINHPTWRVNPQFWLIVNHKVEVTITLLQKKADTHVGFYILTSEGNRAVTISPEELVGKGSFARRSAVTLDITLEAREQPYLIIPCTFEPGKYGPFTLRVNVVATDAPPESIQLLPCSYNYQMQKHTGTWTQNKSGGCRNNKATWLHNPQFSLVVGETTSIIVLLTQGDNKKSIGFYVAGGNESANELTSCPASNIVAKSQFRTDTEVFLKRDFEEGCYNIICTTFQASQLGDFELSIYSDRDVIELVPCGKDVMRSTMERQKKMTATKKQLSKEELGMVTTKRVAALMKGKWEIKFEELTVEKKVGQGSFGVVYAGTFEGQEVAIKKLFREDMDDGDMADFKQEVAILAKCHHPNILQFFGASIDQYPNICIVTEYCSRGNLSALMKNERNLSWEIKLKMIVDAAEGVRYLHSLKPPIVHRDLKSLNLLVTEDYKCMVADFGMSKSTSGASLNSKVGSLNWCAPEILLHSSSYTTKGDVYSFGMILWELLTETAPFQGMHPLQIVRAIDSGNLPLIPPATPKVYAKLIKGCWHQKPERRPDFVEIVDTLKNLLKKPSQFDGVVPSGSS